MSFCYVCAVDPFVYCGFGKREGGDPIEVLRRLVHAVLIEVHAMGNIQKVFIFKDLIDSSPFVQEGNKACYIRFFQSDTHDAGSSCVVEFSA